MAKHRSDNAEGNRKEDKEGLNDRFEGDGEKGEKGEKEEATTKIGPLLGFGIIGDESDEFPAIGGADKKAVDLGR